MCIYSILLEFNKSNSTLDKREVCKKYKDNKLFVKVVRLALDKVKYTFGISTKNINAGVSKNTNSLEWALNILETDFCTRNITGNNAINRLEKILEALNENDKYVLERIIDRDLKINFGKTEFNKIFDKNNNITRPPYTRCEIGTKTNILKNMPVDKDGNFINKVYSEVKMDGTFRRAVIDSDTVEISSRPGIVGEFPIIEEEIKSLNIDGYVLIGELTLKGEQDRSKGNGLINSDNVPHEDILFTVWDMIPIKEYSMSKDEIKKAQDLSLYENRLELLENTINKSKTSNIKMIEYKIVKNMKQAYKHFQEVTERGDEGTVIKSHDMTHKDGNSKKQLKCKINFEIDARIVGFIEGKKGTKREKTFGSIMYETDDKKIKGSVSGFTDIQLENFNNKRDELIGKIIEIEANNITKGSNNNYYALSHPRFIELKDKNTTDTLERAKETLENSMKIC